jgi:predicted DNA-binding transcriptional regulator AlpA
MHLSELSPLTRTTQSNLVATPAGAPPAFAFEPLLTVEQVSQLVGRSVITLEKDRLYGSGPRYVKMGRLVRYRPEDIRAWVAERVRCSTSDAGGEAA